MSSIDVPPDDQRDTPDLHSETGLLAALFHKLREALLLLALPQQDSAQRRETRFLIPNQLHQSSPAALVKTLSPKPSTPKILNRLEDTYLARLAKLRPLVGDQLRVIRDVP